MTRAHALRRLGDVEHQFEAEGRLVKCGDCVVVFRGVQRSLVMRCPDGCGDTLTVNLDPRSGKAWRLREREGQLTLYPSVWRQEGCRAHFILWRDTILWCDSGWYDVDIEDAIVAAVDKVLTGAAPRAVHYHSIAETAGIDPWEALWACQLLQRRGRAKSRDRASFAAEPPRSFLRPDRR